MTFRNDIQILRAIAVAYVLLFHLGVPGFASGFLGVDVFFVVSGFLMEKLYAQNRSPSQFYLRRAKRLLPTYFFVIVATLVACYFVTLPVEFSQASRQTIFASFFVPNVGYWLQNSYFSKAEFNPLLHLWSLGVEIQYYAVVPLVVWMTTRWKWLLPVFVLASLGLCLMVVTISPKTSFFMMPMRFWEFGLGIFAARFATEGKMRTAAGLAGVAAILLCMMLPIEGEALSVVRGHPGLAALAVSLATASVLYFGIEERLLATLPGRILRQIGDMSYSIYLVHFPIIVLWFYRPFGGTNLGDGSLGPVLILLALTAAGAALTYYGLERRGARLVTRLSVPAAMAGAAGLGLLLAPLQLQRFSPYQRAVFSGWTDRSAYRCGIAFRVTNPTGQFCVTQPAGTARETVMLVGDSHADSIKESFRRAASGQQVAVAFAVSNDPLLMEGLGPDWLVAQARALGVRRVFLHYAFRNLARVPVEEARRANAAAGIETILILPVPEGRGHIPQMMYNASLAGRRLADLDHAEYQRYLGPISASLARPRPMLSAVELGSALCADGRCAIADAAGHPYYFDSGHLTLLGARRLEPVFARALGGAADGERPE